MKKALITGIFGQDGSYLAEYLIANKYRVAGIVKAGDKKLNECKIHCQNLIDKCDINEINITNKLELIEFLSSNEFDEIYHLAAAHHSSTYSDNQAMMDKMIDVNFNSTRYFLDAIVRNGNKTRLFYAGSSQMYSADVQCGLINEETPFMPSTFYGYTKLWSQQLINYYRNNYGIYGVTGILFNHESPRSGESFVTRYITKSVAEIKYGSMNKLEIQNPAALVDWSSAKDFIEGIKLTLQAPLPYDYVFGSGECKSVLDIIKIVFNYHELDWNNYMHGFNGKKDERGLAGNPFRLINQLQWVPKYSFEEMVLEMAEHDTKPWRI
jgi:GDPmannose 4,6-dehydratase